jgi:hypothetical protein
MGAWRGGKRLLPPPRTLSQEGEARTSVHLPLAKQRHWRPQVLALS